MLGGWGAAAAPRRGRRMRSSVLLLLGVLAGVLCGGPAPCAAADGKGEDKKDKARRRRRQKVNVDAASLFSGTTPSGATRWKADSAGTISASVDTSHLKFDRAPRYLCTVVADGRSGSKYTLNPNGTLSLEELRAQDALANVTGKTVPLRASAEGFRVRLRYKPETGKNLTETVARLGGWRVRWVAITDQHSLFDAARLDVTSKRFEGGIEDKPVGQALAYVKMLEQLVKEETPFVQGLVGIDYELPLSRRPKPKPKKESKKSKEEPKKEGGAAKGDEGDKDKDEAEDLDNKEQEEPAKEQNAQGEAPPATEAE